MRGGKTKNSRIISQVVNEVSWSNKYLLSDLNVLKSKEIEPFRLKFNEYKPLKLDEFDYFIEDNDEDNLHYAS
jgi:hypothetical protein